MAEKHTVTVVEMQSIIVTEILASAAGRRENKKLIFSHDIGRGGTTYVVRYLQDGWNDLVFDALDEAVAAYNDA